MDDEQNMDKEIIYIGDPMCSWCWGFAPVAERLREHFDGSAEFKLILGGLRPADRAEPLDDKLKSVIKPHWEHVEKLTKQPFNFDFFDREGFIFNTEPPSRAVVVVRRLAPHAAFPFFRSLEQAFYTENLDITQVENYAPLLQEHGIEEGPFMNLFDTKDLHAETSADFAMAHRMGAQGFPTVALRRGERMGLLTVGYQSYERLLPVIEEYFAA